MARILVTAGLSPWPFDRLLEAAVPLCAYHDVFAQTGPSLVTVPCPRAPEVAYEEFRTRLADADIVITHAGATLRLVQRLGRVPLVVARTFGRGEAPDDRQTAYLRAQEGVGRVHAVWETSQLVAAVAAHPELERRLLRRELPPPATPGTIVEILDQVCARWAK